MTKIRILLADDHSLFREGLRSLLEDQADIEIVGEAEDGLEAIKLAEKIRPAVILMDISIIVLTMYPQDEYVVEALKAGAKAYLLKDTRSKKLLEVIRAVHRGQAMIDPDMTARVLTEFRRMSKRQELSSPRPQSLTEQERTILTLVSGGASNKEIAARLGLSERTIKNYLTIIFQKLQVNNRTEAAIRAVKDGLVDN